MPPEVKDETIKDLTTDDKVSSADDDKTLAPDEKTTAALKAQDDLSNLLEDHGFDSIEDLTEAMQAGGKLKEDLGDLDLSEVLGKAQEMDRTRAYWAEEKAKQAKDDEDPDDTIGRLEKEVRQLKSSRKDDESKAQAVESNQKALDGFNSEVTSFIEKQEDYPKEYGPFTELFMGVNNPANEIDITSKAATRKMCKDGVKKVREFEQVVIKRYTDGKIKIPSITKTEAPDVASAGKDVKTLKDARKVMTETLGKLLGRGSG